MVATLESLGIDPLSIDERIILVQQIWDSIPTDVNRPQLTDAQRSEFEHRADDDEVNPSNAVPWEQVRDEALARWAK